MWKYTLFPNGSLSRKGKNGNFKALHKSRIVMAILTFSENRDNAGFIMESIIPYDGKENSSVKHNGTFKTIHRDWHRQESRHERSGLLLGSRKISKNLVFVGGTFRREEMSI